MVSGGSSGDSGSRRVYSNGTYRTYYRYSTRTWSQPYLTSDGVWGGSSFAVMRSQYPTLGTYRGEAWKSFSATSSDYSGLYSNEVVRHYQLFIWNPNPLLLTSVSFYPVKANSNNSSGGFCSGSIQVFNYDTGQWVELVNLGSRSQNTTHTVSFSNTIKSRQYLFQCGTSSSPNKDEVDVKQIRFTGTEYVPYVSTSSNYDYYVDENRRSCYKSGTTYYVFN